MSGLITMGRGPRLAYVIRPVKTKRVETTHRFDPKTRKVVAVKAKEATTGGYMVYTPNGSSYRISEADMIKGGFDKPPTIINFEMVNDTKTPAGRFKFAIDEESRRKAYLEMEKQVIRACQRRGATVEKDEVHDEPVS